MVYSSYINGESFFIYKGKVMNDTILTYVSYAFHPELGSLIKESFSLISDFGLEQTDDEFIDIIMENDNIDEGVMKDRFYKLLINVLDRIIELHGITLNEHEAQLTDRIQILNVIFTLQFLNDFSNVLPILESELNPLEKLSELVSQFSILRESDVFNLVADFKPNLLDILKKNIKESMDVKETFTDIQKEIIKNIKLFKLFCVSRKDDPLPIGIQMVDSGIAIGESFNYYLNYTFTEFTGLNYPFIALNLLSVILLSDEGYKNPVETFRTYSDRIFDQVTTITKVDSYLLQLIGHFERYKTHLTQEEKLI